MTRILIVDDHAILRQGLKQILADEIDGAKFGEAGSAAEVLPLLQREAWDVLVLDINMPGRSGFDVIVDVSRHFPRLPVLVLSSTPEDQLGVRAMKAGAAGYLNKQTAPEQLVAAVQTVLKGGQFISAALAARLVAEVRRGADRPRHDALSDRELEVVKFAAVGKSVKEIAAELSLSAKTISTFHCRALEKLGVRNDVELADYVRKHGLL
jgi:two-component system, NarL family, invasion response regulator UvrY